MSSSHCAAAVQAESPHELNTLLGLPRRLLQAFAGFLVEPGIVAVLGTTAFVFCYALIYDLMPSNDRLSRYAAERHAQRLAASGIRRIDYDIRSSFLRPDSTVALEDDSGSHTLCEGPRTFCRRASRMSFSLSVDASGAVTVRADIDPTTRTFDQAAHELDSAIEEILDLYQGQRRVADSWRNANGPAQPASVVANPSTTDPKESTQ